MRKFTKEFRAFATKGNVFDLAVAVIIGGAFGKITTSFVNDIFTPFMGLILGNVNLTELKIVLRKAVVDGPEELAIRYGAFIQTFIEFILIALVAFIMIKVISRLKKKEAEKPIAPPMPSKEELLLTDIRDLLKANNNHN